MGHLKGIALIILGWGAVGFAETSTQGCGAALESLPPHIVHLLRDEAEPAVPRVLPPIEAVLPTARIEDDLRRHARVLFDTKPSQAERGYVVYLARGADIPDALHELGRAREESFRDVGEGSGQARDNDRFDPYYLQLVVWDKRERVIGGAYRLGPADEILRERGIDGLYSNNLFHFSPELVREYSRDTLELGRTFVRPKYRGGVTLNLLWGGIAKYLVENPRYRHLIGPVSISGTLNERSRQIMSEFMMRHFPHPRSREVKPRTPPQFRTRLTPTDLQVLMSHLTSIDHLQRVVRVAEDDQDLKLPPLFDIYLKLEVQFLAFNWDQEFNALDGLIWTDISKLPFDTHKRYMGEEGARAYRAANHLPSP